MPQEHSDLFNDFFKPVQPLEIVKYQTAHIPLPKRTIEDARSILRESEPSDEDIPPEKVFIVNSRIMKNKLQEINIDGVLKPDNNPLDEISDFLQEVNDAQSGVVSRLSQDGKTWIRDATKATPLTERALEGGAVAAHHEETLHVNNMVIRCLSRTRAIFFAINELQLNCDDNPAIVTAWNKIKTKITESLAYRNRSDHLTYEKDINTILLALLADTGLAKGCTTVKDAEKLLQHYRNLAALLRPARIVETYTYDERFGIARRIKQTPITQKTDAQKENIKSLKRVGLVPSEQTAHAHLNIAMQMADSAFADLMQRDDTLLPAQSRLNSDITVKNAYVVEDSLLIAEDNENILASDFDNAQEKIVFVRQASPVYDGSYSFGDKTLDEAQRVLNTSENISQIEAAFKRLYPARKLDCSVLVSFNTPAPGLFTKLNKASRTDTRIVTVCEKTAMYRSEQNKNCEFVNEPINYVANNAFANWLGVFQSTDETICNRTRSERTSRLAENLYERIDDNLTTLLIEFCASGQDRTTGVVEKQCQLFQLNAYKRLLKNYLGMAAVELKKGYAKEVVLYQEKKACHDEKKAAFLLKLSNEYQALQEDEKKAYQNLINSKEYKFEEQNLIRGLSISWNDKRSFVELIKDEEVFTQWEADLNTRRGALEEQSTIERELSKNQTGSKIAEQNELENYREKQIRYENSVLEHIAQLSAASGNSAFMTTATSQGSPFIKKASQTKALYSPIVTKALYHRLADTNKKNPFNKVEVKSKFQQALFNEFNGLMGTLKEKASDKKVSDQAKPAIDAVARLIRVIDYGKACDDKTLPILVEALRHVNALVDLNNKRELEDPDRRLYILHAQKIAKLASVLDGKPSPLLQSVGVALMVFVAVSLVTIGLLAAIPTGGTSALVAAVSAISIIGLPTAVLAAEGACALTTLGVVGFSLFKGSEGKGVHKRMMDVVDEAIANAPAKLAPLQH